MRIGTICTFILIAGIHGFGYSEEAQSSQACPVPKEFFGFQPGADGEMFDYAELIDYLKQLDATSSRLKMLEVGASPMGKPMFVAFFSAAENLDRLDALRDINRRLMLDPKVEPDDLAEMIATGRVFVMATLSMHSSEVGPSQSLPLIAYDWCTTQNAQITQDLSQAVMMIVPCHNPDGMDMVVHHYRKYKGTKFEGCRMPGVYHKYVGHDNNRDFITLTQTDTQVISDLVCQLYFPQVLVEKHQMGSTGPRYFVPPNHDPIAENIDEGLWRWNAVFGTHMGRDMSADGLSGIASNWLFDNYWPGSTETSLWKNVISFLTEAASCRYARPIYVEPNELKVYGKGLSEYEKSTNMPNPWPGGWWRLSDIIAYEWSSMNSILSTAATYHQDILAFQNEICRKEVARGRTQPPYHFVIPQDQWDRSEMIALLKLLDRHGIAVHRLATDVSVRQLSLTAGDYVVPMAQPYRAFAKEVLENQTYPVRRYTPDGKVIKPYDITSWSLPLHKGVRCISINEAAITGNMVGPRLTAAQLVENQTTVPEDYWALALPVRDNASFRAAFSAIDRGLAVERLTQPIDGLGVPLETGSFLLRRTKKHQDVLTEIAKNTSLRPIFLIEERELATRPAEVPRIGLIETYFHDMDAGWTRYVLDTYAIPFAVLRPGELPERNLAKDFDLLIFPDAEAEITKDGKRKRKSRYSQADYPPEFQKGMGDAGIQNVMTFVQQGGIIICWRRSIGLFTDELKIQMPKQDPETFQLPITDVSETLTKKGLFVPGAFLAMRVRNEHPVAWGVPGKSGAFSRGTPVLQTKIPVLDMDRRVVATFPERDILKSGYAEHEALLAKKPAVVWLKKGNGQMVMMAFNPQFRASTPATYKLLFNAILLPKLK